MSAKHTTSYMVPAKRWEIELGIKRSKFLSYAANAINRQEAHDFIRDLRQQHPQANHVCWAYIAGAPNTTERSMSDDGEPSGTAGMPMLKVLEYSGYGDIAVVVVRYFGGIKLGTGGLQRAYSDAASQVLAGLPVRRKVSRITLTLIYEYSYDRAITRLLGRYDVEDIQPVYGEQVSVSIAVAQSEAQAIQLELLNITVGKIEIRQPAFI